MDKKKLKQRLQIFGRAGLLDTRECYPLLEGISSVGYDVERTGKGKKNYTDNKNRVVRVPLDSSDRSRRIRNHEMGHAVISPDEYYRPENIDQAVMQRAEDMRVNLWNKEVGHSELKIRLTDKNQIKMDVTTAIETNLDESGKPINGKLVAASAAMATKGTADYKAVVEGIKNADENFGELVEEFCNARFEVGERHAERDPVYTRTNFAGGYEESIVNAEMLMELVETEEMPQDAYSDGEPQDGEGDDDADPSAGKVGKGEYKERERGDKVVDQQAADDSAYGWSSDEIDNDGDPDPKPGDEDYDEAVEEQLKLMTEAIYAADADPGPMTIIEPPRQLRLPGSMEGRQRRPADIGRVPIHMSRYATDKYIFTEQGKRPGGCAVLIDHSGSMSLTMDDIEYVLSLAPGAVIGAYSGRSTTGNLVILAKDGRRISQHDYTQNKAGGSNIVDIPALEWLCKQRGPRYWVSDAYMTGAHDHGLKPIYYEYVKKLSRKYKIYRIPCVTEERKNLYNERGHDHYTSLEAVVSGGRRRRKIKHNGKMIGQFSHYDR
jgi:hypothetical protein